MCKEPTVSKKLRVGIENFLYQLDPVRSTEIKFDLGEKELSSWILEFSHGSLENARGLTASLYRNDHLKIELKAELSLSISDFELKHSKLFSILPETCSKEEEKKACLMLENFVSDKKMLETEQFSNGIILIQCELNLYFSKEDCEKTLICSKSQKSRRSEQKRILSFGPVEELHYIKSYPKAPLLSKVTNTLHNVINDFTKNMQRNNNLDCLINLHV